MNESRRALRTFQDYVEDVSRSRYRTFQGALQRLVSVLSPDTLLGEVAQRLPTVDFDAWYELQKQTVGGMVGSGRLDWPVETAERIALQLELLRRLASNELRFLDFTVDFLYVRNNFDDNTYEFINQIFRPFARDFLRYIHDNVEFSTQLAEPASQTEKPMSDELILFISHSSRDNRIAEGLIRLFEKALKISARTIRCTSVDGYRLPAGIDTNQALRREVFDAKLFIALLTPSSLSSTYVLFELGARWGTEKIVFPILAAGAAPSDLKGPLGGLNALLAASPNQVLQMIENAAEMLGVRLEPMSSFSAEVDALVSIAGSSSAVS